MGSDNCDVFVALGTQAAKVLTKVVTVACAARDADGTLDEAVRGVAESFSETLTTLQTLPGLSPETLSALQTGGHVLASVLPPTRDKVLTATVPTATEEKGTGVSVMRRRAPAAPKPPSTATKAAVSKPVTGMAPPLSAASVSAPAKKPRAPRGGGISHEVSSKDLVPATRVNLKIGELKTKRTNFLAAALGVSKEVAIESAKAAGWEVSPQGWLTKAGG